METDAAEIAATNAHGALLRSGDYFGDWDGGQFPYGALSKCPFCNEAQNYTEFFYNGPGSSPSYAICCGTCGAQGPTSQGLCRGDHWTARKDAVRLWNADRTLPSSETPHDR